MTMIGFKSKQSSGVWHEYIFSQVLSEKALQTIHTELDSVKKRLEKLKAVASFLTLQAESFDKVNCFVSDIRRTKTNADDIASFMIRTDRFERFDVCINTKNDFL